jgi:hypothetical protein
MDQLGDAHDRKMKPRLMLAAAVENWAPAARCSTYYRHMSAQSLANLVVLTSTTEMRALPKKGKAKAGRSMGWSPATTSSDIRSSLVDCTGRRWHWIVDNRMRDYGDIDFERRIIRINHAIHRREGELLIDTLFHEELHRLFPYLGERAISGMTRLLLPTLSKRYRNWLYSRIRQTR